MGWVTERYRCTLDVAFRELRDIVERDANEANELLPEYRKKTEPFMVENGNNAGTRFLAKGFSFNRGQESDEYKFWFELHDDQILIEQGLAHCLS